MKSFKILSILIIAATISSCDNKSVVGKWEYPNKIVLTLKKDNSFDWDNKNSVLDYRGLYQINKTNDSIILETTHGFSLIYKYLLLDNKLIIWNHKANSGELKDHIDEILVFSSVNNKNKKTAVNKKIESFILPSGYIGPIYINYGQDNVEIDNQRKRIIRIPENGLVKTRMQESILNLALGSYKFTSSEKEYEFFIDDIFEEKELQKLNTDSIYVCVYGFNQASRDEINEVFEERINGNVLMLEVDTLKNLISKMKKY